MRSGRQTTCAIGLTRCARDRRGPERGILPRLSRIYTRSAPARAAAHDPMPDPNCQAALPNAPGDDVASASRLQAALDAAGMGTWEFDFRTGAGRFSARTAALLGVPWNPDPAPVTEWE